MIGAPWQALEQRNAPDHQLQRPLTPGERALKDLADKLLREQRIAKGNAIALKTIDPSETRELVTQEEFNEAINRVVLKAPV